jgi:hypothetical protein
LEDERIDGNRCNTDAGMKLCCSAIINCPMLLTCKVGASEMLLSISSIGFGLQLLDINKSETENFLFNYTVYLKKLVIMHPLSNTHLPPTLKDV